MEFIPFNKESIKNIQQCYDEAEKGLEELDNQIIREVNEYEKLVNQKYAKYRIQLNRTIYLAKKILGKVKKKTRNKE